MPIRQKKKKAINPLEEAILQISSENKLDKKKKKEIVDIITFCNGEDYLSLPKNGLTLWMAQIVILKCFYKNTIGNEDLRLTKEEWEWLYDNEEDEELDGVTYERNIKDVIKKMLDMERFYEEKSKGNNPNEGKAAVDRKSEYFSMLHLVLGRRGTKCRSEKDLIPTTSGSITFRELCDRINSGEKIGICTYDQKTWKRSVTYDIKAQDNGVVHCFELETKRGIKETSSYFFLTVY